jgi:hypothetical protein
MALVKTDIGRNDTLVENIEYFAIFSLTSNNWRNFVMITWSTLIHFIFNAYEDRFKFTQFKFLSSNHTIVIQGYTKNENESFRSLDFEDYIQSVGFVTSINLDELYCWMEEESSGSGSESELDITKNPILLIGIGIVALIVVIGIVIWIKGKK